MSVNIEKGAEDGLYPMSVLRQAPEMLPDMSETEPTVPSGVARSMTRDTVKRCWRVFSNAGAQSKRMSKGEWESTWLLWLCRIHRPESVIKVWAWWMIYQDTNGAIRGVERIANRIIDALERQLESRGLKTVTYAIHMEVLRLQFRSLCRIFPDAENADAEWKRIRLVVSTCDMLLMLWLAGQGPMNANSDPDNQRPGKDWGRGQLFDAFAALISACRIWMRFKPYPWNGFSTTSMDLNELPSPLRVDQMHFFRAEGEAEYQNFLVRAQGVLTVPMIGDGMWYGWFQTHQNFNHEWWNKDSGDSSRG